jgi:hypothetical protein
MQTSTISITSAIAGSLLCAASGAFAQDVVTQSADQVTDEQIIQVQNGIMNGCVARGLQRQEPEADVRHMCACLDGVSRAQISKTEWQQIVFAGVKKDKAAAEAIVDRHTDALNACTPKR